jgi:hypothetical protein
MRLTSLSGDRRGCRDEGDYSYVDTFTKRAEQNVGARVGRPKTPAQVMKCSAQKMTGWKISHAKNRFKSMEWCHLIADSLGGGTTAENLVAASYGANTHMAAIEAVLSGKTHVRLEVTAFCSAEHVAQMIHYQLTRPHKESPLLFRIDARNHYFTDDDLKEVQAQVRTWLGNS